MICYKHNSYFDDDNNECNGVQILLKNVDPHGFTGVQIIQGGTYFAVKYVPGVHIFRKIWTPGTYLGRSKFCVTVHYSWLLSANAVTSSSTLLLLSTLALANHMSLRLHKIMIHTIHMVFSTVQYQPTS